MEQKTHGLIIEFFHMTHIINQRTSSTPTQALA